MHLGLPALHGGAHRLLSQKGGGGALVTAKLTVCVPRRRQSLMFKELRKPGHAGVRGVIERRRL